MDEEEELVDINTDKENNTTARYDYNSLKDPITDNDSSA